MPTHRYSDGYRALRDVDPARLVAFDVLREVDEEDAYANLVLPRALRRAREEFARFDARDAAFTSELVHGTLRWRARHDWVIAQHLTRPLGELDPAVRDLLRLGLHQLTRMRVPDHAAVAATVDLARHVVTDGPARMVNAVLRSVLRTGQEEIDIRMRAIAPDTERLAVTWSHPTWMVEEFADALAAHGCAPGELEDLLEANNVAPHVTLVARPGLITPEELGDEAIDVLGTRVAAGEVSEYAVILENGDPAALPSIRQGLAGAQDEGSQLAALVAATPIEGRDERWLDLCAGPGGKASLLAAIGALRGAHLLANEVHAHRARLIERATRRLDNVDVISGDGTTLGGPGTSWPFGHFDRIVVDAPCSGLGSLRRRPESRWRRSRTDLPDLIDLQARLLRRATDLLRPGGLLTYVTCSPVLAETNAQVASLLAEGGVELLDTVALASELSPVPLDVPEAAGRVRGGGAGRTLQLWEHRHGTDLMFIAAMRRL